MALRLRFGGLTIVRASDTSGAVSVDGGNYNVYRNLFDNGSSHSVSVADTQFTGDNRTRFRFASWSDLGARTHAITGSLSGGTLTAALDRDFKLIATAGAGGTIASNPVVDLAGEFMAEGSSVQLTATADSGRFFGCWVGDTTSTNTVVTLPMARPFTVVATFATTLGMSSGAARPDGVMGATYADTLRVTGGTGMFRDYVGEMKQEGLQLPDAARPLQVAPGGLLQSDRLHANRLGMAWMGFCLQDEVRQLLPAARAAALPVASFEQFVNAAGAESEVADLRAAAQKR